MPKVKKTEEEVVEVEALYSSLEARICVGDDAITSEKAKAILGWEVEPSKGAFGEDFLLKDLQGNKIRCSNNQTNRPLSMSLVALYQQEHTRKRWRLNGETIIIGKYGSVLEGQHTLVALILACQDFEESPEKFNEFWTDSPTCEKFVVFGVEEDDETINTINTGKPRSLADVLFRSSYFESMKKGERKEIARIAEYCVRQVFNRTGLDGDDIKFFTHAEAIDFILRHERILECIKHIYEENSDGQIKKYISPGYAAGLFYLMAAGRSDQSKYYESRNETAINFDLWEEAETFWTLLAQDDKSIRPLALYLSDIINDEEERSDTKVRVALINKAWLLYLEKKPITKAKLNLKWEVDEEQNKILLEVPIFGGIDIGDKRTKETPVVVPSKEEQEAEKKKIQKENGAKKKATKKKAPVKKKTSKKEFLVGEEVWVKDAEGDNWQGKIVEFYSVKEITFVKLDVGDGKSYDTELRNLRRDEP